MCYTCTSVCAYVCMRACVCVCVSVCVCSTQWTWSSINHLLIWMTYACVLPPPQMDDASVERDIYHFCFLGWPDSGMYVTMYVIITYINYSTFIIKYIVINLHNCLCVCMCVHACAMVCTSSYLVLLPNIFTYFTTCVPALHIGFQFTRHSLHLSDNILDEWLFPYHSVCVYVCECLDSPPLTFIFIIIFLQHLSLNSLVSTHYISARYQIIT